MTTQDVRDLLIILVLASAPMVLLVIVALIRGYTIDLHMSRERWSIRRRMERDTDDE